MSRTRAPDDLPQILWLWLPLGLLTFQLILELALPAATLVPLMSENGPHEVLQAAVLLCGLGVALDALARPSTRRRPEVFAWITLAALCQVYVAGEELSWGQHLFVWTTPEPWSAINDQDETNLHNTSDWLDQKPRALLMIGVLVGGLVVPPVMARWPTLVPPMLRIFMPTWKFMLLAAIVLGVRLSGVLRDATGFAMFERTSEISELAMYGFVCLYMILLRGRLKAWQAPDSSTLPSRSDGP